MEYSQFGVSLLGALMVGVAIVTLYYVYKGETSTREAPSPGAPTVIYIYQRPGQVCAVRGRLPAGATHLKVYFSLVKGQLGDRAYIVRPSTDFSIAALADKPYYVTVRAYNSRTHEESGNTNQLIVPIAKLLRGNGYRQFMYGPHGSVYAINGSSEVVRSADWGDTWQVLCALPGNAIGYAVDSRGWLYFDTYPNPCITKDGGQTFQSLPMITLEDPGCWIVTSWSFAEILPGAHPDYPHGLVVIAPYANTMRGASTGYSRFAFLSSDLDKAVWESVRWVADTDRHIHGVKIDPYFPERWYRSLGESDANTRGPYYTVDRGQTWTKMRSGSKNGPTGMSFFPNGDVMFADDTPALGGGRLWRVPSTATSETQWRELCNPAELDKGLGGFMYDCRVIEGAEVAFGTVFPEWNSEYQHAILSNLNGSWAPLYWHAYEGSHSCAWLGLDSRGLIPKAAKYLFVQALTGLRIPLPSGDG